MSRLSLVVGGAFPVLMFLSAVFRVLSFDSALSSISIAFSIALVPGIAENARNKRGWSRQSTVMTASGLLSMGSMFMMLGLTFTGATTIISGTLWSVLAVQAFVYGGD
jgi:hypothetical protein